MSQARGWIVESGRALRYLALGAVAISVAACGQMREIRSDDPRGCPRASVLRDASQTTAMVNGAEAQVAISGVTGECNYTSNDVTVDMDLALTAEGPGSGEVPVTYFVAVVDPADRILNKRQFQTTIPLSAGRGERIETLRQVIPMSNLTRGPRYQVIAGFQLDAGTLRQGFQAQ